MPLSPRNYKFVQNMLVDTVLFIRSDNSEVSIDEICKVLDQEVKNIQSGNIEYVLELRRQNDEGEADEVPLVLDHSALGSEEDATD